MTSAIVGWGHTPFGKLDGQSLEDLIRAAAREALSDAGLTGADIDAVWLGNFNAGMVPDGFASSMILGADEDLRWKPATRVENACASGSAALYAAIDAIASGRVRTALVVGAEKMTAVDGMAVTRALGAASYQKEEAGSSFPMIFAEFAKAYADNLTEALRGWLRTGGRHIFPTDNAASYFLVSYLAGTQLPPGNPCLREEAPLEECVSSLDKMKASALFESARGDLQRWQEWLGLPTPEDYSQLSSR